MIEINCNCLRTFWRICMSERLWYASNYSLDDCGSLLVYGNKTKTLLLIMILDRLVY